MPANRCFHPMAAGIALEGIALMNTNALPRIESLKAKAPATLVIVWSTGDVTPVDLAQTIAGTRAYNPLLDARQFKRAEVARWGHAVAWNGDIDMGADGLWALAQQQNPQPDPNLEFEAWKNRNSLTLTTAAHALGLTRRTVSAYASGARRVPRTVLLACKGWETLRT